MTTDVGTAPGSPLATPITPELPRTPWTRLPWPLRDLIIFLVLASFAFIPFGGVFTTWWVKALLIGQALAVVIIRRHWPIVALAVAAAFFLMALALQVVSTAPAVPVAVAAFAAARLLERRVALTASAITVLILLAATALLDRTAFLDPRAISLVTIVAAAGALGDAARSRREYILAVTERAVRAEHTRESEAQRRVAEDRLRIARDLHDVVAHQIAVINLHAGVASSTLRTNPDGADESLATIRQASRAVLAEIGDLMTMLRAGAGGESAELAPIGGLGRLDELVAGFAAVGLRVETQVEGPSVDVPPAVDLVAYRVVQEGLTNAHKHGSGTAALQVHQDTAGLSVRIDNPRSAIDGDGQPGYGLQGLRERVESVRGRTRVDDSDPSRFVLEVTLPLRAGDSQPDRSVG